MSDRPMETALLVVELEEEGDGCSAVDFARGSGLHGHFD